jgi:hypothetical protein
MLNVVRNTVGTCALDVWGHASAAKTQTLEIKEIAKVFMFAYPFA